MRVLIWLLRAALFFVLFAFALNNQHEVQLKWFFGYEWRAPMVLVMLAVFGAGCALGVVGMLPIHWRRRGAKPTASAAPKSVERMTQPTGAGATVDTDALPQPLRHGL